jgi:hypothetical protein
VEEAKKVILHPADKIHLDGANFFFAASLLCLFFHGAAPHSCQSVGHCQCEKAGGTLNRLTAVGYTRPTSRLAALLLRRDSTSAASPNHWPLAGPFSSPSSSISLLSPPLFRWLPPLVHTRRLVPSFLSFYPRALVVIARSSVFFPFPSPCPNCPPRNSPTNASTMAMPTPRLIIIFCHRPSSQKRDVKCE